MELILPPDAPERYKAGNPFPHIVLEGVFPPETLDEVLAEFPKPGQIEWEAFDNPQEKKLGMKVDNKIGDKSRQFLHYLNSAPVLRFLENLTGIQGLIPDPYYYGGGLHQILPGGFLKVHADFNWHQKLKVHRRINMLIYLNKDWEEAWGGHLELWDKEMGEAKQKILPLFGRVVVFNTTDFAFHGHPEPLRCPPDRTRKSIALYYYSTTRPREEISESHTTLFMKRHGDDWTDTRLRANLSRFLHRMLPPVVVDAIRAVRRRSPI